MKPFCIVTGTSSGMGEAVARRLCAQGWDVLGVARRDSPIDAEGYRHARLDLADLKAVQGFFATVVLGENLLEGRPRVGLVNNAAMMGPIGSVDAVSFADFSMAFDVNTVAPLWLMGFLALQCPATPVCIVNISSGAAFTPLSGWLAYCASKAAFRMAGQVFAEDIEKAAAFNGRTRPLWVVEYNPGLVDTPMQDEVRTIPDTVFPRVHYHLEAYQQGKVKNPDLPAAEIAALLAREALPPYGEVRYGEA